MKIPGLCAPLFLGIVFSASGVYGCMVAPPAKPVWVTPKGADYQYALDVKNKTITIADAADRSKVRWSTKLNHYVYGNWRVQVIENGKRVVGYCLNRGVRKVSDIVVESVAQDGRRTELAASRFVSALQPFVPMKVRTPDGKILVKCGSMDPPQLWHKKVEKIDSQGILVTNALGVKKSIAWDKPADAKTAE